MELEEILNKIWVTKASHLCLFLDLVMVFLLLFIAGELIVWYDVLHLQDIAFLFKIKYMLISCILNER